MPLKCSNNVNAFASLKCSKKCQHNVQKPSLGTRGKYISVASLVHLLRNRHKDLTAKELRKLRRQRLQIVFPRPRVGTDIRGSHIAGYSVYIRRCHNCYLYFNFLITYIFINLSQLFIYLIYLSYKFIYLLLSAVRHPPSAVLPFTESRIFVGNGTQYNSTLFMLSQKVNGFKLSLWSIPMLIAEVAC